MKKRFPNPRVHPQGSKFDVLHCRSFGSPGHPLPCGCNTSICGRCLVRSRPAAALNRNPSMSPSLSDLQVAAFLRQLRQLLRIQSGLMRYLGQSTAKGEQQLVEDLSLSEFADFIDVSVFVGTFLRGLRARLQRGPCRGSSRLPAQGLRLPLCGALQMVDERY